MKPRRVMLVLAANVREADDVRRLGLMVSGYDEVIVESVENVARFRVLRGRILHGVTITDWAMRQSVAAVAMGEAKRCMVVAGAA